VTVGVQTRLPRVVEGTDPIRFGRPPTDSWERAWKRTIGGDDPQVRMLHCREESQNVS
jgi:hypothetical protein